MGNQDWSNLGDQIKNTVQNAIDSQDFKKLNETIRNTVNDAISNVNSSISNTNWTKPKQAQNPWEGSNHAQTPKIIKSDMDNSVFNLRAGNKGAGYALSITGGILAGCIGTAILILLMITMFAGVGVLGLPIAILLPFFLGTGWMAWKGGRILGRIKRFRLYVRQLRGRKFCTIKELSEAIGKSPAYVAKDVKDMVRRNMFRQGHVDEQSKSLVVTDELYNQYLESQRQYQIRQQQIKTGKMAEEAQAPLQNQSKKEDGNLPKEVQKVIEEGREYLLQIEACNDAIPDQTISDKISRLEVVTGKIFERVEAHPEQIPDLKKFMEYYLPTTIKLLKAYEELNAQPVQGENIKASKREIENTLDTINQAFEKLLDGFFKDASWDIAADISVLQTMFAQEGLTGQDFKKQ